MQVVVVEPKFFENHLKMKNSLSELCHQHLLLNLTMKQTRLLGSPKMRPPFLSDVICVYLGDSRKQMVPHT